MANTPRQGNRVQDTMDKAKTAASNVGEKAKETTENISEQVRNVTERASDMASGLGQRAGETVSAVAGQMRHLASTIRESVPEEGVAGSAASAIADTLESGGTYLEGQSLTDIADDVSAIIRQHPMASVMVCFGCGYLLARSLRS